MGNVKRKMKGKKAVMKARMRWIVVNGDRRRDQNVSF